VRIGRVVDTPCRQGDNGDVLDLNDLRAFEKVAATKSFAAAARALGLPRSSVSRSVARLEGELDARLFQRTTREVALTSAGEALLQRCSGLLGALEEAVERVRRTMTRHLCPSPSYLDRRGTPASLDELGEHDTIQSRCQAHMGVRGAGPSRKAVIRRRSKFRPAYA
jgi:molybdenum-dependent DNA-binding transcriptional regulator ModE